jgi:hypothetical protein
MGRTRSQEFLAIWQIETENLDAVYRELRADLSSRTTGTDAFDTEATVSLSFTALWTKCLRDVQPHVYRC